MTAVSDKTENNIKEEKKENPHKEHRKRVKEEFLANGFNSKTPEHKILELLLFFCIPRIDTNDIAHQMIDKFGSISGVLDAPVEELVKFKGITESNAVLLKLIMPVSNAYRRSLRHKGFGFRNHDEIGDFLRDCFLGLSEEKLGILCLNGALQFLSFDYVASGDLTSVGVSTRKIIEYVLKTDATCVIMAHNHPGGIALPSPADEQITQVVSEALSHIGVHLLDHVVIADDDYVSMVLSHQYEHLFKNHK
ncbi:MAG: hypothetical protein E7562_05395 [Ruminococcaceae bacterium]|nr:hypothetical protein [Oscillospiraceae bacterium]